MNETTSRAAFDEETVTVLRLIRPKHMLIQWVVMPCVAQNMHSGGVIVLESVDLSK